MAQMGRRGLSASQKRELWERWKRGQSLNNIARALARRPRVEACVGPRDPGVTGCPRGLVGSEDWLIGISFSMEPTCRCAEEARS
jgi:hypothetical protein